MPTRMNIAIERAIKNIITFGDTDVFPFPFERYLFEDEFNDCVEILRKRHKSFDTALASHPPLNINALSPVGYTGFRRVTEIEPFWNAYYLALVISIANDIEKTRIPKSDQIVFSYRYSWKQDANSLFSDSIWYDYRKRAAYLSKQHNFVVLTDVADFYSRVNHHRLENALKRLPRVGNAPKRIIALLKRFSDRKSYGLPVGGPPSRILAELSLNNVDRHLRSRGVNFCRYADDFTIFCPSISDSYKVLVDLSDSLSNEGLSLQKSKTKIMPSAEFREMHEQLDPKDELSATDEQRLLALSIKYDPYSPTAEQDYEDLKNAVKQIDVVGILSREIAKTTIDQAVVRQAIGALRALDVTTREQSLRVLLDPKNIVTLAPVFSHVMRTVRGTYDDLENSGKDYVDEALISLHIEGSHLLSMDVNLAYYIQAMSIRHHPDKERVLTAIFNHTSSPLLRRMVIHSMANWECHYMVSAALNGFASYNDWERRAILMGSYCLTDEGRHWRKHVRNTLGETERLVRDWAAKRKDVKQAIPV